MTENKTRKLISAGAKLVVLIVLFVFAGMALHDRFEGCFRLYREIGASPWTRPETLVVADSSERWSDGAISKAQLAAIDTYENRYYTYNGAYLMKLIYDDGFNSSKQNSGSGEFVYLRSEIRFGYSRDVVKGSCTVFPNAAKGATISDGYWTVEHMPDGSWYCHGWSE